MRRLLIFIAILGLSIAACGDDTPEAASPDGDDPTTAANGGADSGGGNGGSGSGSGSASNGAGTGGGSGSSSLTPIGPVAENTIQIGDQTWSRTLPMTQGQCVVFQDNGTLPDSAIVWGTLDDDEDIRFSANQLQDGTFQSEVQGDDFFWIAGTRSPGVDDLEIELDFDALTVIGEGTFSSILGDTAAGSFHFKCLPEDQ